MLDLGGSRYSATGDSGRSRFQIEILRRARKSATRYRNSRSRNSAYLRKGKVNEMIVSKRMRQLLFLFCLQPFLAAAQGPSTSQQVLRGADGNSLWFANDGCGFLVFFPDGTVNMADFPLAPAEVESDLKASDQALLTSFSYISGHYSVVGSSVSFSVSGRGTGGGTIDYTGVVEGSSLRLNWLSHIDPAEVKKGSCSFELVAPGGASSKSPQGSITKSHNARAAGGAGNPQQPAISTSRGPASGGSKTFFAGSFKISQDVGAVLRTLDNNSFACTLIQPLENGTEIAAMTSEDQAWSIAKTPGGYPIEGMVKSSDGKFRSIFPAVLKAKVDIRAGAVLHSGRYDIETQRPIKAGDSIPALFIGGRSLLSIDSSGVAGRASAARPWFTVFEGDAKPDERRAVVEAWAVEENHVAD